MNKHLKEVFYNPEILLNNNNIELQYHYSPMGYLKMMIGGTPIPESIDVYRKKDHTLIKTIKDKELLDKLADD